MVGVMNGSINSSNDFSHDNSDYQWFLDYSCREGISYQSVLSSLYESYIGINELSYYDDIANNLDANLAEMDIESFRAEDMSLLLEIPNICKFGRKSKEMDSSIYKTKSLFSPVKESHISLDSLDLDLYPENKDIILTCKANKSNYTIAFEGSTLYSDESFYVDPGEITHLEHYANNNSQCKNYKYIDTRMIISEHYFPTMSKLENKYENLTSCQAANRGQSFRKSVSLPNINHFMDKYDVSDLKIDSDRNRNQSHFLRYTDRNPFENRNEIKNYSRNSAKNEVHDIKHPAFNLVKIFIQQKSSSTDARMDVSSGCWPSSEESSNSSLEKSPLQAKNINSSGEWLHISHSVKKNSSENFESFQLDSLDVCDKSFIDNSIDVKSLKIPSREHKIKHFCNVINNNNNNYIKTRPKEGNSGINMHTKSTQTSTVHLENALSFKPLCFCKSNILDKLDKGQIFVIYPNYSLPDLNFVNTDNSKIFFTPYKLDIFKKKHPFQCKNQRNEDIIMKNIKPDYIKDWMSLLTLLPYDIARQLEQIPEAVTITQVGPPLKPMFCLPFKRNKKKFCDCVKFLMHHEFDCCRSESTENPFSSGYRGSSTVLTDSVFIRNKDGFNEYIEDHMYNGNDTKINLIQPKSILRNHYKNRDSMLEIDKKMLDRNKSDKRFSLPISYKYRADEFVTETKKQCCDENKDDSFISQLPAELKNFQKIAQSSFKYDPFKLKTEVSETSHKKVSFNEKLKQQFVTPPNSPDNSIANTIIISNKKQKPLTHKPSKLGVISSNRFKRLQVQWELLSKESSLFGELKSEDSSPVPNYHKSKIPRPIGFTTLKKESTSVLSNTFYRDQRLKLTKIPSLRPKIKYSGVLKYPNREEDSSVQKIFNFDEKFNNTIF